MIQRILILGLLVFTTVFSAATNAAGGWTNNVTVEEIYAVNANEVLVKLSTFTNPHNCTLSGSGDIHFNPSSNPEWMSIFLSAYMAGTPISVYASGSCSQVWAGITFADVGHVRML